MSPRRVRPLAQALAGVEDEERPLILFDTYERISGLDGLLRARAAPRAGRRDPGRVRRAPPARRRLVRGRLGGGDADARGRAARRGRRPRAARAPGGSRRVDHDGSLRSRRRVSARAPAARIDLPASVAGSRASDREADIRALVSRLTDTELDPTHRDVLAVAAIARLVTPALLADVLPDRDPARGAEMATARGASPSRCGVASRCTTSSAGRSGPRSRHRDPEREHVLRRAIADHLYGAGSPAT